MATLAVAIVNRILANDSGSVDVYFEVTANGNILGSRDIRVAKGANFNTIIDGVIAAAKQIATAELGVTFQSNDTVECYHPSRTVA